MSNFQYINYRIKVSSTSRYESSRLGYYGKDKKLTFATYKRKRNPVDVTATRYEISKEYEFRPDKASTYFYGVPDYWWKIMEANNMKDVLEFRAGRNIILPGGTLMF